MKKHPFSILLFCFTTIIYSQETCINADFENGNLDNWITSGIVELVSGANDYYGNFPVSAPGGFYSLKLGNSTEFPQPESTAKKSFFVSDEEPYILYQFALVNLGYPHETDYAARSSFKIMNSSNIEIPCTFYEVFAADGGPPGFELSSRQQESNLGGECCYDISFLKWNSILVDLRSYIGQLITIELKNSWCFFGPDWAYSYFDAQCTNLDIVQNCNLNDTLTLKAPNAAISYLWNTGDTTQSIQVSDLTIGENYSCTFTYDGINDTCEDITISVNKKIIPKTVLSDFGINSLIYCLGDEINLTNLSSVQTYYTNDSINYFLQDTLPQSYLWIYGNSQINYEQNPTIIVNDTGNQNIRLIVKYDDCTDTSSVNINVYNKIPQPIINAITPFCTGDLVKLYSDENSIYEIIWSGPANFNSKQETNIFNLNLENIGYYSAYYDNDTCPSEIVSIYVTPENPYTFENINIPNIITTNDDSINDEFNFIDAIYNCQVFEITFYNRWGEKVYFQTNTSEPFKGIDLNKQKLEAGVYFYTIEYQTGKKSGFVHVQY